MRETKRQFILRHRLPRLALVLPAVFLSACQALQTPVAPSPHLNITPSTDQATGTPTASGADSTTYTVKRDTLPSTLTMQGRVAPSRSAQLTLRGGGTVTAVEVQVGQNVKQGDTLAQFAADDQTLQAARTQATLTELAFEQEQTKLDQLQAGAPKDTVDQAQAVVARDQAAIAQLYQQAQAAQDGADKSQKAAATAKAAADRKVLLAQVAMQAAQDSLSSAQATAQEADDATKAAQTKAQQDAAAAVVSGKQAVTTAQRAVTSANLKLSQAKMNWAITKASQSMETQQFKVGQDTDALRDAKTADQAAQKGTAAQATAADTAMQAANRALQADQLELQHDQTNLDTSHTVDEAAIQQANLDLQTAQDQLTQAQATEQKAEQRVQDLAQQSAVVAAASSQSGPSGLLTPAAAQAAIRQAQHALDTANLNLADAQATADEAGDTAGAATNVPTAPDQSAMGAAQAQLVADQSHLASLQSGASSADVAREQARVSLLRDQAAAAAAGAQPVMALTAPFDGTVTDVGITIGQTISPGMAADSGLATVGSSLAGQTNQGEPVAIRMVAGGTTSIVADASESDVAQLKPGQSVDVTFPGLTGQSVGASISQIASTPTIKDGSVSYPVQIDLTSPPTDLKLGMTAQVSVKDSGAATLIAPRAAVQTVGGQSSVTKIDPNGQTESVQVQLGKSGGGDVELVGGSVQEGDKLLLVAPAAPVLPLVASQRPNTSQP
jgi:macrolide-specific efflux system membrane fusion protein